MPHHAQRIVPILLSLGLLFTRALPVSAADPEIDRLLQSPVGKDWITNGGNMTNQRYSTLQQIDTSNVKQLKGAWMTRLKGSGLGGKYSLEATPPDTSSSLSSPTENSPSSSGERRFTSVRRAVNASSRTRVTTPSHS
jgi:hypothetical protein